MKSAIYYPNFEIQNSTWIKFALLYLKEVNPIIPSSAYSSLSPSYIEIINSSNLIKPYESEYSEGNKASLRTIRELERILRVPKRNVGYFERRNYYDRWKVKEQQDYEIFSEKYSQDFLNFCIENNIGHYSWNGIKVSEEVAFIYMSILANEVSKGRDASPITDNKRYNDLLLLIDNQLNPRVQRKKELAHRVINLKLPGSLEEMDIYTLIKLREKDHFERKLSAFHKTLDDYLNNIGLNQDSTANYLDSLNESIESIYSEVANAMISVINLGLQVFVKGNVSIPELVPVVISANELHKKYSQINDTNNKVTKKFLTDLSNLEV